MQNRFRKVCIFFGVLMLFFALFYTIIMEQEFGSEMVLIVILSGLTASIFFWLTLKMLDIKKERNIKLLEVDLKENEYVLSEGPASHCKNKNGVEGKLFLTTDRLIFKSHTLSVQNYQTIYELKHILSVDLSKTWGFVNYGVKITSIGSEEKFTVDYSSDWKSIIEKQMVLSYL